MAQQGENRVKYLGDKWFQTASRLGITREHALSYDLETLALLICRQKCQYDQPHQRTTRLEFGPLPADSLSVYQS